MLPKPVGEVKFLKRRFEATRLRARKYLPAKWSSRMLHVAEAGYYA
ncbi:hypothetical protein [Streptomyces chromofuscus]|nr:hypothetical protein [Streptomyces chromofuscus]